MNEPVIRLGGRTVVAMVHVPALPGAPDYDPRASMQKLHDWVSKDLEALQSGGVDAVMFGNEFDRPYVLKASPEGLAAMTAVIVRARSIIDVPFGVNYLWDPVATVSLKTVTIRRGERTHEAHEAWNCFVCAPKARLCSAIC